jgi:hypothetical protein
MDNTFTGTAFAVRIAAVWRVLFSGAPGASLVSYISRAVTA